MTYSPLDWVRLYFDGRRNTIRIINGITNLIVRNMHLSNLWNWLDRLSRNKTFYHGLNPCFLRVSVQFAHTKDEWRSYFVSYEYILWGQRPLEAISQIYPVTQLHARLFHFHIWTVAIFSRRITNTGRQSSPVVHYLDWESVLVF